MTIWMKTRHDILVINVLPGERKSEQKMEEVMSKCWPAYSEIGLKSPSSPSCFFCLRLRAHQPRARSDLPTQLWSVLPENEEETEWTFFPGKRIVIIFLIQWKCFVLLRPGHWLLLCIQFFSRNFTWLVCHSSDRIPNFTISHYITTFFVMSRIMLTFNLNFQISGRYNMK